MQRLYSKPLANSLSLNISIVGMNGSGKSAVLVKYLTRRFIVEYAPYLSDSYTKNDSVDGQEVTLNIQDTCDSDDMDLDEILKWSQAIIILFSVTSRRSFYRAQELLETMQPSTDHLMVSHRQRQSPSSSPSPGLSSNIPSPVSPLSPGRSASFRRAALCVTSTLKPPLLILVANKSDLDRFRLVERVEAEEYAKSHGIPYFETTAAKTYHEVQAIFHSIVRLSVSNRAGKLRGQNGNRLPIGGGSSTTVSPTSVLSSLAVSPGLLLQKKTIAPSIPLLGQDTNTSVEGESTNTNSTGRLANLRFRAASPPSYVKNLRSPSPGWVVGKQSVEPGFVANPQAQVSSTSLNSPSAGSVPDRSQRATTPLSIHRVNSTPKTQSVSVTEAPAALSGSVQPPPPPPLPPKKSTMGFRFFSKKSK
ncbi:unnamed protein product [Calicophoron daubneyi]|uniref:small monomeric GTPase n=1 Tax=Calicophoron daubneyi TaxID=300641 RepID=A0AAV2U115_CALDB